jgi:hypothetical protein
MATFNVAVDSGNYDVYFRINPNNSATDDSFYYRVDGGAWTTENNHTGGSFIWVKGAGGVVSLSGTATIEVANRENGLAMDKIQLVPAGDPAPSGMGETANNCGVCTPATSCSGGAECGTQADGCGGSISCGSCSGGDTCNTGTNMCEASCSPATSCSGGAECGTQADGCGGSISCGSCSGSDTCNTGTNMCEAACVPSSICSAGAECGTEDDGCGGQVACGSCAGGDTCNASNQCETPSTGACNAGNSSALVQNDQNNVVAGQCYSVNKGGGNLMIGSWSTPFTVDGTDSQGSPFTASVSGGWSTVTGVANGTAYFTVSANSQLQWSFW